MESLLLLLLLLLLNIRKERQQEGIEKAQQAGKHKGRKPTARAKTVQVMKMLEAGLDKKDIAKELNIGIASIYRIIKNNNPIDNKPKKKQEKSLGIATSTISPLRAVSIAPML